MLIVLGCFVIAVIVKHVWALLNAGQTLREVEEWHNKQTADQQWEEREISDIDHQEIDSVKIP